MCLQMAELDKTLGGFFAVLDSWGLDYEVVLTADHGGHDMTERQQLRAMPGESRVSTDISVKAIGEAIGKQLGIDVYAEPTSKRPAEVCKSSLAYAKRKTEELGFQNIDYMQADILDLGKLDRKFDIIESSGVLHHLDEPMAGWRSLTDCLELGGLMKIGLYSELARQHIVRMREEINQSGIGSSDVAMRSFRSDVINSSEEHHKRIRSSINFYSLSELRDLLFHVQEHRFTIPQLKDCLSELDLKFCGFEADVIVRDFKLTNTGADDPYNLDKWHSYEEANPNTFIAMYQFWCQKVA
jgi:SAM-dependent methyltransferase